MIISVSRTKNDWNTRLFPHGATVPSDPGSFHRLGFTITLKNTTFGRTPLGEWSANAYTSTWQRTMLKRQISLSPEGLEPTFPSS